MPQGGLAGQVLSKKSDSDYDGEWTNQGVTAILAQTLTYNTAGQLITAVIGSATFTMTYDSLGRLATVSDGTATMTCTYNAYGQFTGTTI